MAAQALPDNHATVARDYQAGPLPRSASGDVDVGDSERRLYRIVLEKYPNHLEELVSRIRTRHYSIRTEKA